MSDNPEPPPPASGAPPSPAVGALDHRAAERRHHLRAELFWTVVTLVAFTGLEFWLEHTALGHRLEIEAHHWFRSLVDRRSAGQGSAVVIVDIGSLKQRRFEVWSTNNAGAPARQELEFTPRDELQKLLEAIAAARPAAIGFDLDLSPERDVQPGPALALATSNLLAGALTITGGAVCRWCSAWLGRSRSARPAGWGTSVSVAWPGPFRGAGAKRGSFRWKSFLKDDSSRA